MQRDVPQAPQFAQPRHTGEVQMSDIGTRTVAFVLYPGLTPLDLIGRCRSSNAWAPIRASE
jgi:hypothetical protein